ncbi:MAG: DUF4834 family protein [Alistipes sp.]|nr:DUF4834 family protein [Alistipes sp.]
MNFLTALIDSIIDFVQRNPLTTIILVMLMVFAPSVFGVLFVGIIIAGLALLAVPLFMLFRLRRASRKMEDEFRQYGRQTHGSQHTHHEYKQRDQQEGEVKVYTTNQQPQKRVSDEVGDYVDFEEVDQKNS